MQVNGQVQAAAKQLPPQHTLSTSRCRTHKLVCKL